MNRNKPSVKNNVRLPYAVIFDMDGVLLESEAFMRQAAMQMFAEKGLIVQPEDFMPFVGAGENRYIGGVAEKYGFKINLLKEKKYTYQIYYKLIKGKLGPLPGVFEFLDKCRRLGKKMAVASSADLEKVLKNFEAVGLDAKMFDAVVSGDDVERKKPNPDIFLLAAEKMGLKGCQCLVVEDALNGIAAAHAAEAKCLALATSFSRDKLAQADWVADNLADVPSDVLEW